MLPAQTMKVAAALHNIRQHSQPVCLCSQNSDLSQTTAQKSNLQALRAHLSESWHACQG